ncbi:MAG: class I SAM-dependent methyltransferase [Planctomycetota bacterium]
MKEQDIRPRALFDRYLALAEEDIERFFRDMSEFVTTACPACGESLYRHEFEKRGFQYTSCKGCGSLYLNPRPRPVLIDRYYRESEAARFWSTEFYPATAESRRERIFRPRAELAREWGGRLGLGGTVLDVGPGYGLFLDEISGGGPFERAIGVEPGGPLATECRARGHEVIEATIEGLNGTRLDADLAVNFEVLEHVAEPKLFLEAIRRQLRPGGVLILTTLTCSGFDIQVLWQDSKSVHPPHHINLISIEGMRALFDRSGFEILELSTPGRLDVSIVENAIAEDQGLSVSRFARRLLRSCDETKAAFQSFLAENELSSHIRVVARRREDV